MVLILSIVFDCVLSVYLLAMYSDCKFSESVLFGSIPELSSIFWQCIEYSFRQRFESIFWQCIEYSLRQRFESIFWQCIEYSFRQRFESIFWLLTALFQQHTHIECSQLFAVFWAMNPLWVEYFLQSSILQSRKYKNIAVLQVKIILKVFISTVLWCFLTIFKNNFKRLL